MDKDGSGHLDKKEIAEGLKAAGYNLSAAELEQAINSADKDGNGHIDYHGSYLKDFIN
jgi:Ca2+-binding EF-hand superfamily protein